MAPMTAKRHMQSVRPLTRTLAPHVLPITEVARLAKRAGFSNRGGSAHYAGWSQVDVAVALAQHESGFNANAVNTSSGATGLWQIYPGGDRYLSPTYNALTAHRKYLAQGWDAWSAFPPDQASLLAAHKAATGKTLDPGQVQELTPADAVAGVAGAVGSLIPSWLSGVLPVLKIAAGGAGLVVTLGAIVALAGRNSPPGQLAGALAAGIPTPAAQAAAAVLRKSPAKAVRAPERPDVADARAERRSLTDRGRRARVDALEAKAKQARSEAYVSKVYEREARAAQRNEILPRHEGAPRSRPSNYRPPGSRAPANASR